jgi:hypothetical protein
MHEENALMKLLLKMTVCLLFLMPWRHTEAQNYQIFSISQDFPMGEKDEVLKKNYFINMGQKQGIEEGTNLNVFRIISELDSYEEGKRYNLKVKVGEVKVVHADLEASIAVENVLQPAVSSVRFDIPALMIGDRIEIKLGQ